MKIDTLPQKIKINNHKVHITKGMKIVIKHLESLSEQTILLIENRTILLQNQLEIEKAQSKIKEKSKARVRY